MTTENDNWHLAEDSASFLLAEEAAWWILEKKGEGVLVIDLRGRSDVCDFFVLATGQADTQVRAIARSVHDGFAGIGQKPLNSEGVDAGRWVLLDFVDVVVHIFQPKAREYYNLERLWGDAPKMEVAEDHFDAAHVRARHTRLPLPSADDGEAANEPEAT